MDFSLGWVHPNDRTPEQQDAHLAALAKMPKFAMPSFGGTPPKGTKILLTNFWGHERVVAAYGRKYTGCRQVTGFCVGAGGQNVLATTSIVDVLQRKDPVKLALPLGLFNYGMSRKRAGFRGEGEGSFGSTFADSCKEDGSPDLLTATEQNLSLPVPDYSKGFCWGRNTELHWSDASNIPSNVTAAARKRLIKTVSPVGNAIGVRDAILQGYGLTRASMKFVNPGTAHVKDGALVGTYTGRGGHQESWLGYWHHETLGELVYEMNQWGLEEVYGVDPGGGAPGGTWISLDSVEDMCNDSDAEVYAFSQYDGFPAQPEIYDWALQSFFS